MRGFLVGVVLSALLGCAAESIGPTVPIRGGGTPDARLVDFAAPDAARPDAASPTPDASPPPPPAERAVWYLQRHDDPAAGLRAALEPPQRPAPFADPALPVLVEWAGPDSPGAEVLTRRLAAGLPSAPFYRMTGRVDRAAADVSWLASRALESPDALTLDGRPVLALAPAPDRDGLADLRARLARLPVAPFLLVEVDLDARPWPSADGVFPRARTGPRPDDAGQSSARMRAGRAAALAAGWAWAPRAGAPPNARLDDPAAAVSADAEAGLIRSLVVSRRMAAPIDPLILVDGLGAWQDDRQLDPVDGETTATPAALTDGAPHVAYGQARLAAVTEHLQTIRPTPPPRFTRPAILLEATHAAAERIPSDDGDYAVVLPEGRADWLLDGRPFRLPPNTRLTYTRTGDAWVDLEFADGPPLHERLPIPPEGAVSVDLSAFSDAVVEAVVIQATGDGTVRQVQLLE